MISTRPDSIHVMTRLAAGGMTLLLAFLATATASAQSADQKDQDSDRWYFEFQAGPTFALNQTIQDGTTGQGRIEPDRPDTTGAFNVGGALGREMFDFLRAELAVSYREIDASQAGIGAAPHNYADGDISLLAVMGNVYADLDLDIGVIPFAGIGIGFGEVQFDVRQKTANVLEIQDSDIVFVYNAMVGTRIPLTEAAELSAAYRYIATPEIQNLGVGIAGVAQEIEAEFDAHEIVLGLRFFF